MKIARYACVAYVLLGLAGCVITPRERIITIPSKSCTLTCVQDTEFPATIPIAARTVSDLRYPRLAIEDDDSVVCLDDPPLSFEFYLLPDRTLTWRLEGSEIFRWKRVTADEAAHICRAIDELTQLPGCEKMCFRDCRISGPSYATLHVRSEDGYRRLSSAIWFGENLADEIDESSVPPGWAPVLTEMRGFERHLTSLLSGGSPARVEFRYCVECLPEIGKR